MDIPKRIERAKMLKELGKKVGVSMDHLDTGMGSIDEDSLIEKIERRLSAIQPADSKKWWQDPYKRLQILIAVLGLVLAYHLANL